MRGARLSRSVFTPDRGTPFSPTGTSVSVARSKICMRSAASTGGWFSS
jgi:hypothetical protein